MNSYLMTRYWAKGGKSEMNSGRFFQELIDRGWESSLDLYYLIVHLCEEWEVPSVAISRNHEGELQELDIFTNGTGYLVLEDISETLSASEMEDALKEGRSKPSSRVIFDIFEDLKRSFGIEVDSNPVITVL